MRKKETKKELEKAITLWKNEGKKGIYYTGYDLNKNKVIGFLNTNKKNEKQPDITIYNLDKDNKLQDKICSLWINTDKNEKDYLSGLTTEDEKVVGFINEKATENIPYINIYFKEEE